MSLSYGLNLERLVITPSEFIRSGPLNHLRSRPLAYFRIGPSAELLVDQVSFLKSEEERRLPDAPTSRQ